MSLKKEKLTEDLIKQDLIYQFKNDNHMATNIILLGISLFFAFLFSFFTPFSWLIVIIPVLLLLIWYIYRRKKINEIEKGEFTVVLDEFLYDRRNELRTGVTAYKGKYISYLQFFKNGRWEIQGYYYMWSDTYKMSDAGICNTSRAKDIFYVVLYKRTGKIAMAYNTKFFDYKNDIIR